MSDSEVEECVNGQLPVYWQGINLFETDTLGKLLATATTYTHAPGTCPTFPTGGPSNFSSEPTGVAINPSNSFGHPSFFFSDDDQHMIFEVDLGQDGKYGTADDTVRSFSTTGLSAAAGLDPSVVVDPEGVAFGQGKLFVASGGPAGGTVGAAPEIYQIDPGLNGIFEGGGDDVVTHFNVQTLDNLSQDPEGVAFNPDNGHLYTIGPYRYNTPVVETLTDGTLVQKIDTAPLNACAFSDAAFAPGSLNPGVTHLYLADRGVDNNADPLANDGKVYEVAFDPAECALRGENLLLNPGFEIDCNNNTVPDRWDGLPAADPRFTRSTAVVHGGSFAGKHFATDDSSYTLSQTIKGLSAGTPYTFSGWVNIPPTTDAFQLQLVVIWRSGDPDNPPTPNISTTTLKTYTAATNGWDPVVASLVAPAGTTNASVRMVVSSLNATIYVDDFLFTPTVPVPPTITAFTPNSGSVETETVVTITGSNFTGALAVAFNGVPATAFTVDSDTQIKAAVPSGATTGLISVTTVAGTGVSATAFTVSGPPSTNLLLNPGFELDANGDNLPDNWTPKAQFTRSNEVVHSGSFAGKHFSSKKANYTISQIVNGLTAGTTYNFSGWVNIPLATGTFEFRLEVTWRKANNKAISTTVIKKYTTDTTTAINGWDQATASLAAPAGTVSAEVRMVVKNLQRTIYVDDFGFLQ